MTSDYQPEKSPATVPELISEFQSSFLSIDFQNLTKKITQREETLKNKNKELEKMSESLKKEKDLIFKENKKVNGLLKKKEDELKKKENEVDEMKKVNDEYVKKVWVYEKRFLDLSVRVLGLEKMGKELVGSGKFSGWGELEGKNKKKSGVAVESCNPGFKEKTDSKKNGVAPESNRQHISGEKGDSKNRRESKFPEIIVIDNDEDDYDDLKNISISKRKRVSNQIKREDDSEDDECISVLRRKHASKTGGEYNDDYVGKIPTGTQPKTFHTASPFLDSSAKVKKENERWESEADMLMEFAKDDELCMNAVCALHRQKHARGSHISRITNLAEVLVDGDAKRKLKRKASELTHFERDQCRMFAKYYSVELFKIYQQKADPFFPPSTS